MKHITTFFLINLLFTLPLAAQQWEPFSVSTDPVSASSKLNTIQDKVFLVGWDGLYRSNDGGEHWQKIRNYQPVFSYQLFEVNHQNNRLYFSEGPDTSGHPQLFMSANLGNSWTSIGNVKSTIEAFIGDTLYGRCAEGVCSKVGTIAWAPLPGFPADTAGTVYAVAGEGTHLWAVTPKGIYHSADAGHHWEISFALNNIPVDVNNSTSYFTLHLKAVNGEVLMADEVENRIVFTKDNGTTWQQAPGKGSGCTTPVSIFTAQTPAVPT